MINGVSRPPLCHTAHPTSHKSVLMTAGAFLLISQFLRLAAIRRGEEDADRELPENIALEGLLAQLYAGDNSAVVTMQNIIQGSSQKVISIDGKTVDRTCRALVVKILPLLTFS
jgi:hypothetical protein